MDLKTNMLTWEWVGDNYDKAYATTNDPRVVALIQRNEYPDLLDGDAYAPAFRGNGQVEAAGSTFMDDASTEIADRYRGARAYFVNRHYVKGGRQMNYDRVMERYLRIFHDTTVAVVGNRGDQVLILNTPTWREHVGIETLQDGALAIDAERHDWQAALDGESFGVGFAVNADRLTDDEEIDLNDGSWTETIACWGFLGEEYAKTEAAGFEYDEPDLQPLGEPRLYRVSYSFDVEADSPEQAARNLAGLLGVPGVPERGSYDVRALDGTKVITVDFGEGQF